MIEKELQYRVLILEIKPTYSQMRAHYSQGYVKIEFSCFLSIFIFIFLFTYCDFREGNVFEHMVKMLEKYSGNLEKIVEERTKLLIEEKKKTDDLVYRMLPR